MMGIRYQCDGRLLTIVGIFEPQGEDPGGYDYVYDDDPTTTLWISTTGAAARFQKIEPLTPIVRNGLLRFYAARERRVAGADVPKRA